MLLSGQVFLRESRWSLLSLEADYVQVSSLTLLEDICAYFNNSVTLFFSCK